MAFKKLFIYAGQPFQIKGKQPHGAATESKGKAKKFSGHPVPKSKCKIYCSWSRVAQSS